MPATLTEPQTDSVSSIKLFKEENIAAPVEIVFQAILDELGPHCQLQPDKPFPMTLEPFPGGRWFRDLGNNTGHLWGHVQVIKPPTLLEIIGPMPMSYPAINHIQYRLAPHGAGTLLKFTHQAMGLLDKGHREGMQHGWAFMLDRVRQLAEAKKSR
jgi:uncharacterized protein YndB with AHSA1/START domain